MSDQTPAVERASSVQPISNPDTVSLDLERLRDELAACQFELDSSRGDAAGQAYRTGWNHALIHVIRILGALKDPRPDHPYARIAAEVKR